MLLEHTAPFLPVYYSFGSARHPHKSSVAAAFLAAAIVAAAADVAVGPNTWAYCLLSTSHSCGQLSAKLLRLEPRKIANLQLASGNVRPCNCIKVFDDVR